MRLSSLRDSLGSSRNTRTKDKESFNPNALYWEEILELEKAPVLSLNQRKAKRIIEIDNKIDSLMVDPIKNEAAVRIERAKMDLLSEDLRSITALLDTIECLKTAYIETTVKQLDAYQQKEKQYQKQIEELQKHISRLEKRLTIGFAYLVAENAELIKERRQNVG